MTSKNSFPYYEFKAKGVTYNSIRMIHGTKGETDTVMFQRNYYSLLPLITKGNNFEPETNSTKKAGYGKISNWLYKHRKWVMT